MGNDIKGVIIGNKIDLEQKRDVRQQDLEEIGKKYNMPILETSAKQSINVNEGFELLVNELLKGKNENQIVEMFSRKTRSDLSISSKTNSTKKQKSGCC